MIHTHRAAFRFSERGGVHRLGESQLSVTRQKLPLLGKQRRGPAFPPRGGRVAPLGCKVGAALTLSVNTAATCAGKRECGGGPSWEVQDMRTFGTCIVRGRRSVPRVQTPLIAKLYTPVANHSAILTDLSRTGARLRGETLPGLGKQLIFQAAKVRVAGQVAWVSGDQRGVEFDTPIAADEVNHIRALANLSSATAAGGEELYGSAS